MDWNSVTVGELLKEIQEVDWGKVRAGNSA
jgi:hypothetical protein